MDLVDPYPTWTLLWPLKNIFCQICSKSLHLIKYCTFCVISNDPDPLFRITDPDLDPGGKLL
jgi:hypothetical protein